MEMGVTAITLEDSKSARQSSKLIIVFKYMAKVICKEY